MRIRVPTGGSDSRTGWCSIAQIANLGSRSNGALGEIRAPGKALPSRHYFRQEGEGQCAHI